MPDTHECPAPGCSIPVRFERFACPAHWYAIPAQLRRELSRHWRHDPGSDEYFAVRAACLLALGVPPEAIADVNAGVDVRAP